MNAVRLLLGTLRRRGTARPRAGMGVALAVVLLAGCTYRGTIDQPITIKLTWYSYLAGEDIRQTCVDSALPHYRLIYNGHYDEQIRSYEVVAKDDDGAHFTARVLGPMRAFAVIRDPLDLQDPWRWTVSEARLGPEGFAAFVSVLEDSGLWRPFAATMNLLSTEFYWVASGCRDGQFVFNAWRFDTPRYDALAFPDCCSATTRPGSRSTGRGRSTRPTACSVPGRWPADPTSTPTCSWCASAPGAWSGWARGFSARVAREPRMGHFLAAGNVFCSAQKTS